MADLPPCCTSLLPQNTLDQLKKSSTDGRGCSVDRQKVQSVEHRQIVYEGYGRLVEEDSRPVEHEQIDA